MNSITTFLIHYGYLLVFIMVLGERLGLPLPSGIILILAGALTGSGQLNFALVFLVAVMACLLNVNPRHQFGLRKGSSLLPSLCRISLNPEACIRNTQNVFYHYGVKSLLVVKFIPGVNMIAAPLSGILRTAPDRFLFFDLLGSVLWVGVFISLGYFAQQSN